MLRFDLSGIPDVPTCEGLHRAIMRCTTVRDVEAAFRAPPGVLILRGTGRDFERGCLMHAVYCAN